MKLTRLCSEFSYGDWIIHKFGVYNGNAKHLKSNFRDYFYFKADQVGQLHRFKKMTMPENMKYSSLYGDDCVKVEYTSINEKKLIEEAYGKYTYELDVSPEFKYLNQGQYVWADASDRHIAFFDIETHHDSKEFIGPENPIAAVTSIQLYSTKLKSYVMFTWHPDATKEVNDPQIYKKNGVVYVFCHDEIGVIESFLHFLNEYAVDVITGWNSSQFDVPYLINRCKMLNINKDRLSPINRSVNAVLKYDKGQEVWRSYIVGLDHIDMMVAFKDLGYNLPNYKLATAAKVVLKDKDIEKMTEVTWKDWLDNFVGFTKYGLRDVEILKELDEKIGIFDLYCHIQQLTNITSLDEVQHKSAVVDKLILTKCKNEFVFPTRKTVSKQNYMGATVLDPIPGLFIDVGVVDYASLYPTSIMAFNLSPETFICSQAQCEERGKSIDEIKEALQKKGIDIVDTGYNDELIGKRYLFYAHSHKIGLLPKILKPMYDDRVKIKTLRNTFDEDTDEYKMHDKHQTALKVILNTAYGAFGFNFFRLYKPEVADSITFFARRLLDFAIEELEKTGFGVIYGDTDSVFFTKKGATNENMNKWVDRYNKKIMPNDFIPVYNPACPPEYDRLELEYEKDLERIYFGDKKKRYYGITRTTNKKYIRGMNIIRKDTPDFLKKHLDALSEKAVKSEITVEDLISLREMIGKIEPIKIGVSKSFTRPFDKYLKTQPQHLKAAEYANNYLGTRITHTDVPLLFYIKSKCEDDKPKGQRSKAICLLQEDMHLIDSRKEVFELDYDMYFKKQVLDQLKEFSLIECVNTVLEEYKEKTK